METKMAGPHTYPGIPRWVKIFGVIAAILLVLLGILKLTGHGPGRHKPSGSYSHPSEATESEIPGNGHVPQESSP